MALSFKVARYGAAAWVYTLAFIAMFLFFAVRTGLALAGGFVPDTFDLGVSVLSAVLLVYAWLRSVRGYKIEGESVVVERAGPGRIHFTVDNLQSVGAAPDLGSFLNTHLLTIGGLFGWAGKVRVRKPSDVDSLDAEVYGTNPAKSVLLQLRDGHTVILTPEDPVGFAAAVQNLGVMPGARDQGLRAGNSRPTYVRGQSSSKDKKRR